MIDLQGLPLIQGLILVSIPDSAGQNYIYLVACLFLLLTTGLMWLLVDISTLDRANC